MGNDIRIIEEAGRLARQAGQAIELHHIKKAMENLGLEASNEEARRVLHQFGMEYTGSEVMGLRG